jgi:hypothetical protein
VITCVDAIGSSKSRIIPLILCSLRSNTHKRQLALIESFQSCTQIPLGLYTSLTTMSPTLPTADAEDEYEEPYIDPPSPSQAGQPGNLHSHYQRVLMSKRNIANPSPLGLSGFAFTTLLLSAINLGTLGVTHANIVVVSAFAYGGLVQLLARMWPVTYLLPRKFFIVG